MKDCTRLFCSALAMIVGMSGGCGVAMATTLSGVTLTQTLAGTQTWALGVSPNIANDSVVFTTDAFDGTLYKSTDKAATWQVAQHITPSNPNNLWNLAAIAVSPAFASDQTLFIGGGSNILRGSTTGGASVFVPTSTNPDTVWGMDISPTFATDHTVVAAGNSGFSKSTDGGLHFITTNTGLAGPNPNTVAMSPNFQNDQTIFIGLNGSGTGVYKSLNGGATWSASGAGLPTSPNYTGPAILQVDTSPNFGSDGTVFAAVRSRGLYRSTNGGANWLPAGVDAMAFAMSPNFAEDRTMVAAGGGVWSISFDQGLTWSNMGVGAGIGVSQMEFSPDYGNDHTVFATSTTGFYTLKIATVPEPGTLLLVAISAVACGVRRTSRKRKWCPPNSQ